MGPKQYSWSNKSNDGQQPVVLNSCALTPADWGQRSHDVNEWQQLPLSQSHFVGPISPLHDKKNVIISTKERGGGDGRWLDPRGNLRRSLSPISTTVQGIQSPMGNGHPSLRQALTSHHTRIQNRNQDLDEIGTNSEGSNWPNPERRSPHWGNHI